MVWTSPIYFDDCPSCKPPCGICGFSSLKDLMTGEDPFLIALLIPIYSPIKHYQSYSILYYTIIKSITIQASMGFFLSFITSSNILKHHLGLLSLYQARWHLQIHLELLFGCSCPGASVFGREDGSIYTMWGRQTIVNSWFISGWILWFMKCSQL